MHRFWGLRLEREFSHELHVCVAVLVIRTAPCRVVKASFPLMNI